MIVACGSGDGTGCQVEVLGGMAVVWATHGNPEGPGERPPDGSLKVTIRGNKGIVAAEGKRVARAMGSQFICPNKLLAMRIIIV